jgi:D-alanine-D-alanine ligase
MRVGITYDLRQDYLAEGYGELETAEFDRPATIDAIKTALQSLGFQTDRIGHARALIGRLAAGDRWDLVFNIAEGLTGVAREAQVPAILEVYGIPCTFSDASVMALTLHKGMTKHVVRGLGLPTPDFAVIGDLSELDGIDLPYPLFAKPVAEGTGKGVTPASKIADPADLRRVVAGLLTEHRQPVLVETFLPGREFTVGIVGTGERARSVGVAEVCLNAGAEAEVYSYKNKELCEELVTYRLVDDELARRSAELSLAAWRGLGCRDGGRVDVRVDAGGVVNFIEVNPLAGLHPEHSDLPIICNLQGIPYLDLMDWIVRSTLDRLGVAMPERPAAGGRGFGARVSVGK